MNALFAFNTAKIDGGNSEISIDEEESKESDSISLKSKTDNEKGVIKNKTQKTEYKNALINLDQKIKIDNLSQTELWDIDKIIKIHLRFSDLSWKAKQPYGGLYGINGSKGGWNEGNFLFPTLLKDGDSIFDGIAFDSVSIRYKGNGTLLWAKKNLKRPLKIDLNDGFPGRKLAKASKINLHSLSADIGYMNDAIAYQLYRDGGVPATRTTYSKVYFTVSDTLDIEYLGLYLMVENADDNFANHWYGKKKVKF